MTSDTALRSLARRTFGTNVTLETRNIAPVRGYSSAASAAIL
jgi:hypothetical protein